MTPKTRPPYLPLSTLLLLILFTITTLADDAILPETCRKDRMEAEGRNHLKTFWPKIGLNRDSLKDFCTTKTGPISCQCVTSKLICSIGTPPSESDAWMAHHYETARRYCADACECKKPGLGTRLRKSYGSLSRLSSSGRLSTMSGNSETSVSGGSVEMGRVGGSAGASGSGSTQRVLFPGGSELRRCGRYCESWKDCEAPRRLTEGCGASICLLTPRGIPECIAILAAGVSGG